MKENEQKTLREYEGNTGVMDKWKNQDRLGSIYVFLMIFCFKISGNKNQELKKEIEILRSDSEARFNYEYFSTSEEIEKLLSIQKE